MSFFIWTVIGWVLGSLIGHWGYRLTHRKQWMDHGYEDAMLPYTYRFRPDTGWIRKYYNQGYELGLAQKDREKNS